MSRETNRRAREHEAERARLLTMIDATAGPLTDEQKQEIAELAAQDVAATWDSLSVDARRGQRLGLLLAQMLQASGITDAEPGSSFLEPAAGGIRYSVVSRSRGRVVLGTVASWALVDLLEVPPLDRQQAAKTATASLSDTAERRVRRTAELVAQGMTTKQIAETIASEEGRRNAAGEVDPFPEPTVKTWRRKAKGR